MNANVVSFSGCMLEAGSITNRKRMVEVRLALASAASVRRMRTLLIALLVLASVGCGAPETAPAHPKREPVPPTRSRSELPNVSAPVASTPSSASPPSSAPVLAGTEPPTPHSFPPPDLAPPHARSAVEGDGRWKPFGEARGPDGAPLLVTTTIRPHAASKLITLTLVAIDRTRTELGFMPGVDDVGKVKVPFAPGLVPEGERQRVLAAFNGGF